MTARGLIVDDDMDFAQGMSARLHANSYEPAVAFDALQAIKLAQNNSEKAQG